jgi:long-chain acyl-CoA synthetase
MKQEDTLPKLLKHNYGVWGQKKTAIRHKRLGIWQEFSWKDYYENVKHFALGLKALGFREGDKICILGDNEPEWYWAELACQSLRGASVGIFVDSVPNEVKHIVNHSDAVFVVVKDQEQTDKMLQIRGELCRVKMVIYWDARGMWSYRDPFVVSFEEVQKIGKEYGREQPNLFEGEIEKGDGKDMAIICYTSGTSGLPKGVMITHDNLITTVENWFKVDPWHENDNYLSCVPPAWINEQAFGITGGLFSGAVVSFPERPETVENDVREIGPSVILYNARMWEDLSSKILGKIEDGSWFKRALFNISLPIGYRVVGVKMDASERNTIWKLPYWIANLLVFRPLRDKIGLRNAKSAYTGGALISPGCFRLFRALGVNLRDLYGTSEASQCCCNCGEDAKFETIGFPMPGMEVRINKEGQMLWKGPCVFHGYYKDPDKSAEALADGWYNSGDAGDIDEDGHLLYLDRLSHMMELEGGLKYGPQQIEGRLKFSPFIKDVVVCGGGKIPYVIALVQISLEAVGKWAERCHIPYTTFADLSQKQKVYDLVEKELKHLNTNLPEAARVKKFVCLHKELDPDEEELTRTRKLRRDFLMKKYNNLIDAIVVGKDTFFATSEVKYSDGSQGVISTSLSIRTIL